MRIRWHPPAPASPDSSTRHHCTSGKQAITRARTHACACGTQPGAKELFGLGKKRQRNRKPATGKSQPAASQPSASQQPVLEPGGVQGNCPLRGMAKPLAGLLASTAKAKGQYKCPEAVIRMRAAVAGLKPVRLLRPQASNACTATPIMAVCRGGAPVCASAQSRPHVLRGHHETAQQYAGFAFA